MTDVQPTDRDGRSSDQRTIGKVAHLAARIARLEAKTEQHAAAFDALERAANTIGHDPIMTRPLTEPGSAAHAQREPEAPGQHEPINMPRLVRWVSDNVAGLVDRRIPTTDGAPRWCLEWWQHAEAIARFEALRQAWEDLVAQGGTAMLVYFRDYLDPTLGALMAEAGPFARCKSGRHVAAGSLGQEDPPAETFAEPSSTHGTIDPFAHRAFPRDHGRD